MMLDSVLVRDVAHPQSAPLYDVRRRVFTPMQAPRRVVSLVPSMTETLFALGLGKAVVGYTRFCVHPADQITPERWVGGTKNPKIDAIQALAPELILANLEENRREDIEVLETIAPVWLSYPRRVVDAIDELRLLGRLLNCRHPAENFATAITRELARTHAVSESRRPWRYAYLIWHDPWMAAGDDTFINDMLLQVKGQNIFAGRYPACTLDELRAAAPDIIFLPSEPYPFSEAQRAELISAGFQPEQVALIDGEYLCWHGVRLVEGLPYLRRMLNGHFRTHPTTVGVRQ